MFKFTLVLRTGLAVTLVCACVGQSTQWPHFEVASVKPVADDVPRRFSGGPGSSDPTRITYTRALLPTLIADAYSIRPDQVSGPNWIDNDGYAVTATLPAGTTKDQLRLMTRSLLAERFGLKFHMETREISGFELLVARGGPKVKPSPPLENGYSDSSKSGDFASPATDADGFPVPPLNSKFAARATDGLLRMTFRRASIALLADRLSAMDVYMSHGPRSNPTNSPGPIDTFRVFDRTGLSGEFDFHLEFPMPTSQRQLTRETGSDGVPVAADPDIRANLSGTLEKQLGLKLSQGKIKIDHMVIDHVERTPVGN
jgi:uncharacterized protein (TIGR03435 family)